MQVFAPVHLAPVRLARGAVILARVARAVRESRHHDFGKTARHGSYGTSAMARIALDIDSTLHHYWDLLDALAQARFGIALPYESQKTWSITQLEPEQLKQLVDETHAHENVVEAEPYPGAVEAVTAWHEQGHWIHITSH